jgi:hypothetical protein
MQLWLFKCNLIDWPSVNEAKRAQPEYISHICLDELFNVTANYESKIQSIVVSSQLYKKYFVSLFRN